MADLFISHSHQDVAAARDLRQQLEAAGYTCWVAPDDVTGPIPWAEQILHAIDDCRVMIVLISQAANNSNHVSKEVGLAVERSKPLLPIRVEDVMPTGSLQYLLQLVQWVDAFPGPIRDHLDQVRRFVAATIPVPPPAAAGSTSPIGSSGSPGSTAGQPAGTAPAPGAPDGSSDTAADGALAGGALAGGAALSADAVASVSGAASGTATAPAAGGPPPPLTQPPVEPATGPAPSAPPSQWTGSAPGTGAGAVTPPPGTVAPPLDAPGSPPPPPSGWQHPGQAAQPAGPKPPPRSIRVDARMAVAALAVIAVVVVLAVASGFPGGRALPTEAPSLAPRPSTLGFSTPVPTSDVTPTDTPDDSPSPPPVSLPPDSQQPTFPSESETALLGHVPALIRSSCEQNTAPDSLRAAADAIVDCYPTQANTADFIRYAAFPSAAKMNLVFNSDVQFAGTLASGTASACPSGQGGTGPYSRNGATVGRVLCYVESNGGAIVEWTFDAANIVVLAQRTDGNLTALDDWWGSEFNPLP